MWLVTILLLLLIPVSWIGLLISWPAWMRYFETGKAIEPSYLSTLGLFSLAYVGLQILVMIWLATNAVKDSEDEVLVSTIFFTALILAGVMVIFS